MIATFQAKKPPHIEDSVPLRVVTTAMALTGVITALQLSESDFSLGILSIAGCLLGSYISYRRRYAKNFIVKVWISVGILFALFMFFSELLQLAGANIADARIPLTRLLLVLIALHCFDLPRRRDLSVSALVGVTLMTVASTLSRELDYAIYLGIFAFLSIGMFQMDCGSRSASRARYVGSAVDGNDTDSSGVIDTDSSGVIVSAQSPVESKLLENKLVESKPPPQSSSAFGFSRGDLWRIIIAAFLCVAGSLIGFALIPRLHINMQQFKFGGGLPYQLHMQAPRLPDLHPDTSIQSSPNAYTGFSEELDTNYRGKLGDQVVLRVSSNDGTYLRGMGYDTFDGQTWRMSKPKEVSDRVAGLGNSFDVATEVPSTAVRTRNITQEIFVEQDSPNIVVCPRIPYQMYFPSANLEIDNYMGVRSPVGVKKDMVYTVMARMPMFNYPEMRERPDIQAKVKAKIEKRFHNFLQVPSNFDPKAIALAEKIGGEGNNYAIAERLGNYLQNNFAYDLDLAPSPASRDSVSDFLFHQKRGGCEQFASALAILCRTRHVPSMLVTGYPPGSYNPFTGLWEIKGNEAHSWVEIYMPKYGWVDLDPTPGSMMSSDTYQEEQSLVSYFQKMFEPAWLKLKDSPAFGATARALQGTLGGAIVSFLRFEHNFPQLFLLAVGLATALSAAAFFVGRNRGFSWRAIFAGQKAKYSGEPAALGEASREFILLSKSLKLIGVERLQSETAADLLARVESRLSLSGLNSREYLTQMAKFIDLYGSIRFGGASGADLAQLKQMGLSLRKTCEELSKQRNTLEKS
jgi:hypothetical protein